MKSSSAAKKTALCAMLAALSVAILAIGTLVEVLDISLAVIAGAAVMLADLEFSEKHGWSVFAVTALLSFLLPNKSPSLLYALFFGWYPLFRRHLASWKKWLRILVKFVLFNALIAAYLSLSLLLIGPLQTPFWMLILTILAANAMFCLYDPALDRLTALYVLRFRDRLGFHRR